MADYPDGYFRGARKLSQPDELDAEKILSDAFEMGVNHGKGLWNDFPHLKKGILNKLQALIDKAVVAGKIEELERFKKSPYWPKIWLEVKNRLKELGADDEKQD